MQKQLLITYDYELYLGNRSGLIADCMIDPTNKLMEVMGKYGVHAVFFVDTTYLLRLKEQSLTTPACARDFETIAGQLRDLVGKGNYVFPHIHPHWLDAEYIPEKNQWKLNSINKYRFHNITPQEREKVFTGSVALLNDILLPLFPGYKVNAYRAGGWGIQPFNDFKPYFQKHGIVHEFSVLSGIYQFSDAQYFDFSDAPAKVIYRFEDDVCKPDPNGTFIQYSISSIRIPSWISFLEKIWIKVLYRVFKDHTFHKGEGQPSRNIENEKSASVKGNDLSNTQWERISVELLNSVKIKLYKNFLERNKYMHFISHPKMITNHNIAAFGKFLDHAYNNYEIETDFHKMKPE